MRLCLILIIAGCFVACSPSKRLAKLFKKHPELNQPITVLDTVVVPELRIDTFFQVDTGTAAMVEALEDLRPFLDSNLAPEIIERIRTIYKDKQLIKDTQSVIVDGVTVRLWQIPGGIGVSIYQPERLIIEEDTIPCPVYQTTWWESFFVKSGQAAWMLLFLGIIAGYIYGKFKRN